MTDQLTVWTDPAQRGATDAFRSIHYLGSKRRVLDPISEALDDLDGARGTICDLFAGSGPVARSQAQLRNVVAVDIQEYARVLVSALLRTSPLGIVPVDFDFLEDRESELHTSLSWAFEPLLANEAEALDAAETGRDPSLLADIVERSSVRAAVEEGLASNDMQEAWRRLASLGLASNPSSAIAATYGGVYFSYAQAIDLDCVLDFAHSLEGDERNVAIAAVLSTASELVASVGNHFAQPIRVRTGANELKIQAVRQVARLRRQTVFPIARSWLERYARLDPLPGEHHVMRMDYRQFLASYTGDIAVIYADPPYTRDHYSRFYHVLETMALRDVPTLERRTRHGVAISRGLYRAGRHQSPFCIQTQAPGALDELFAAAASRGVPVCLSYSPYDPGIRARPRLLTMDRITAIARTHFSRVRVEHVADVTHSKLNASQLNAPRPAQAEALVLCEL